MQHDQTGMNIPTSSSSNGRTKRYIFSVVLCGTVRKFESLHHLQKQVRCRLAALSISRCQHKLLDQALPILFCKANQESLAIFSTAPAYKSLDRNCARLIVIRTAPASNTIIAKAIRIIEIDISSANNVQPNVDDPSRKRSVMQLSAAEFSPHQHCLQFDYICSG